jgi:hypothetical protein
MKPELIDKAPNGTVGVATKSGWVNEEKFLEWFDHFIKCVLPKSRDRPVVLIMDGHSSHTKNLLLIEKARENNVILLSLPSHCTHRMQPLDVSVFKSLKTYYNQEIQCWLRRHPGRPVTEYQIAELFAAAYGKSATVGNATSGFRDTGIVPFNSEIFSDVDFTAAAITDQELGPEQGVVHEMDISVDDSDRQPSIPFPVFDNNSDRQPVSPTFISVPIEGSSDLQQLLFEVIDMPKDNDCQSLTSAVNACPVDENSSAVAASSVDNYSDHQPSTSAVTRVPTPFVPVTFYGILRQSQTPYQRPRGAAKRTVAHALNLTASPYKAELEKSKQGKLVGGKKETAENNL